MVLKAWGTQRLNEPPTPPPVDQQTSKFAVAVGTGTAKETRAAREVFIVTSCARQDLCNVDGGLVEAWFLELVDSMECFAVSGIT